MMGYFCALAARVGSRHLDLIPMQRRNLLFKQVCRLEVLQEVGLSGIQSPASGTEPHAYAVPKIFVPMTIISQSEEQPSFAHFFAPRAGTGPSW